MMRWLPFPLVSAALLAMWLLLNQTLNAGQILLGGVLALCGSWLLLALQPARAKVRRPGAAVRLGLMVLIDIIRSNIAVAGIILGSARRRRTAGFLEIPLELRSPYALAMLACIITSTPGTLWAGFDSASGILTIHVLDLIDESAWIHTIKGRYERRLLEIFE